MIRLLVTGGRAYSNRHGAYKMLDMIQAERGIAVLIHGGATGADQICADWAAEHGCWVESFPVTQEEWKRVGKKAGPLRNQRMITEGRPDVLLALDGNRGTENCIRLAHEAGIEIIYEMETERW